LLLIWPLFTWRVPQPAPGQFEVSMLDVGQGLAVLVQTANHALLYDTGAAFSASFNAGSAVVVPFLRYRGVGRIQRLLISHPARDHAGGLDPVLDAVPVDRLLADAQLARDGLSLEPCQAGRSWHWDGVGFHLLHPQPGQDWAANDSSCVLLVEAGTSRLLLTGDLERGGESALMERLGDGFVERLSGAVVQVGHHGSRTSSSPTWVEALAAPLALVSSGYRNPFGFPAKEVVERWRQSGSRVLNTAESGTIRLLFDPVLGVGEPRLWRQQRRRHWQDR
ncbi:MAG: DNA internalization-related competence protein ComEC/Rec2, partial [Gammaproteobacteria bacterium SHHR-1]